MPIENEDALRTLYDRINERIDRFEAERRQDEEFLAEIRREQLRETDDRIERIFGMR